MPGTYPAAQGCACLPYPREAPPSRDAGVLAGVGEGEAALGLLQVIPFSPDPDGGSEQPLRSESSDGSRRWRQAQGVG